LRAHREEALITYIVSGLHHWSLGLEVWFTLRATWLGEVPGSIPGETHFYTILHYFTLFSTIVGREDFSLVFTTWTAYAFPYIYDHAVLPYKLLV